MLTTAEFGNGKDLESSEKLLQNPPPLKGD
jgi:hypothetical protein